MKNCFKFMPMFWEDYLIDAGHLTAAEHGAYLMLICRYWTTGKPIPDNDTLMSRVARLTDDEWRMLKPTICGFFSYDDGVWRHKRIDAELAAAAALSAKKREAINKRWQKEDPTRHVVIPLRRVENDDPFN